MKWTTVLSNLTGELEPIREVAERLAATGVQQEANGAFLLGHQPHIAPEAYALRLYPAASEELIATYERLHSFKIPNPYRSVLMRVNGLHAFDLSLFGIPLSMAADPPLLDRTALHPFDLRLANRDRIATYGVSDPGFYFGAGPYSYSQNVGYFLTGRNTIRALRSPGELAGEWTSISEFLADQVARAEAYGSGGDLGP